MIYYPIALYQDEGKSNYGVIIPDLPGCYPVGDTEEEAIADAKAAALFHIEGMIEAGMEWNKQPRRLSECRNNPEYKDAIAWAIIEIDESAFTRQVRFNVSWPEYLLNRVDEYATSHHETRSGFLAKAVQERLDNLDTRYKQM